MTRFKNNVVKKANLLSTAFLNTHPLLLFRLVQEKEIQKKKKKKRKKLEQEMKIICVKHTLKINENYFFYRD